MDTEQIKTIGLILLAVITIGSISYTIFDTGEEITCRTNKPNGWEIVETHGDYFKAICPYVTKEPVVAYCSSFRATPSYERYGCNEILLVEKEAEKPIELPQEEGKLTKAEGCWGDCYKCNPGGCEV